MNKTDDAIAPAPTIPEQLKTATQLIELSKNLNATLNRDTIVQSLTYILSATLGSFKIGIFLHTNLEADTLSLHRNFIGLNTENAHTYSIAADHPLVTHLHHHPGLHHLDKLPAAIPFDESLQSILNLGVDYIIPTRANNAVNGLLLLAGPGSSKPFSPNHTEFLTTGAILAGIALRNAHLYQVSTTDMMTKLKLRHHFMSALREAYARASAADPLAIIMLDIDHFKSVNDTYGHAAGDIVIKTVARLMADTARHTDMAARLGGEEFVILLPHSDIEQAHVMAERMRATIESSTIEAAEHSINITISIGIAELDRSKDDAPHAFLERADDALYYSKEHGRNQITRA